jgi:MFS family permease
MCSYFADRFGRRAALLVGIILVASGIFGEVFATANGAFLVGKMVLGFGLGFYLTVGPMYCSEVSFSSLTLEMSTNKARCLLSDFVVSQRPVSILVL